MKSLKMFLGAASVALLFSLGANAQENGNRDDNGKIVRGAYETNRVFDNWFIGLGGGVNTVFSAEYNGKLGASTDVFVGKWFTPSVGARLGWKGLTTKLEPAKGYELPSNGKYWLNQATADVMWNVSNALSGYKETRTWDHILYFRTALLNSNGREESLKFNLEYGAGLGWINDFRLGNHVDLYIDLSAVTATNNIFGAKPHDSRVGFIASATAGLIFNLGKTGFDRHSSIVPVVVPVPFTVDQYNALKAKEAALEKENADLKDRIAELEKNPKTVYVEAEKKPATTTVYFDCGSATLSQRELAHLEYYASSLS
ncbi:MAG: hypothetical protein MJZ16_12525, partial [Bacteroidales bacterium]|nr:hypothetical protein [Bacteroidales bacterium]